MNYFFNNIIPAAIWLIILSAFTGMSVTIMHKIKRIQFYFSDIYIKENRRTFMQNVSKSIPKAIKSVLGLGGWSILFLGFGLGATFIFVQIVDSFIPNKNYYILTSSWVEVIGTISKITQSEGVDCHFSYTFHNTKFNETSLNSRSVLNICVGEKYVLKVNPDHPECYFPILSRPLFAKNENTTITFGEIYRIVNLRPVFFFRHLNPFDFRYEILFRYKVNGEDIERGQAIPLGFDQSTSSLKPGDAFEIEYLPENPRRAILHLNKPR